MRKFNLIILLLFLALMNVASTEDRLLAEIGRIFAQMQQIEKKQKDNPSFPFFSAEVKKVVSDLNLLNQEIAKTSWALDVTSNEQEMLRRNFVSTVERYLVAEALVYNWYARAAHATKVDYDLKAELKTFLFGSYTVPYAFSINTGTGPKLPIIPKVVEKHSEGANLSAFSFDQLQFLNLHINKDMALWVSGDADAPEKMNLVTKKAFSVKHNDSKTVEFFISEQEKQFAEYMALQAVPSEVNYPKLVQFAALRELVVNRWSFDRMSKAVISDVYPYCGKYFLSFNYPKESTTEFSAIAALNQQDQQMRFKEYTKERLVELGYESIVDRADALKWMPELAKVWNHKLSKSETEQIVDRITAFELRTWLVTGAQVSYNAIFTGDRLNFEQMILQIANFTYDAHKSIWYESLMAHPNTKNKTQQVQPVLLNFLESQRAKWIARYQQSLDSTLKSITTSSYKFRQANLNQKVTELLHIITPSQLMALIDKKTIENTPGQQDYRRLSLTGQVPSVYKQLLYRVDNISDLETLMLQRAVYLSQGDDAKKKILTSYVQLIHDQLSIIGSSDDSTTISGQPFFVKVREASKYVYETLNVAKDPFVDSFFKSLNLLELKTDRDLLPFAGIINSSAYHLKLVSAIVDEVYSINPLFSVKVNDNQTMYEALTGTLINNTQAFDMVKARNIILQAIKIADQNNHEKLRDACLADYKVKKNQEFHDLFRSSKQIRQQMMSQGEKWKNIDEHWASETSTLNEKIMDNFIDPLNSKLFWLTIIMAVSMAFVGPLAPILGAALAFINIGVFGPLTVASLYLRFNSMLIEKPNEIAYQEALAGSSILAGDVDDSWQKLKQSGKFKGAATFETVEQARAQLGVERAMSIAFLPMDIWFGKSILRDIKLNRAILAEISIKKMMGSDWYKVQKLAIKELPSYRDIWREQGFKAAVKTAGRVAVQETKLTFGLVKRILPLTQEQLEIAFKNRMAATLEKDKDLLRKEISSWIEYNQKRLNSTKELLDEATIGFEKYQKLRGRVLDVDPNQWLIAMHLEKAPELMGKMSLTEVMQNPKLWKYFLLPKSFYTALKNGKAVEWWKARHQVMILMNKVRGYHVALKIEKLKAMLLQLENTPNIKEFIYGLDGRDIMILEEMSKGPGAFTYGSGLFESELAKLHGGALVKLRPVFEDNAIIRQSVRTIDQVGKQASGVAANAMPTKAKEQAKRLFMSDMKEYYQQFRTNEGFAPLAGEDKLKRGYQVLEGQIVSD